MPSLLVLNSKVSVGSDALSANSAAMHFFLWASTPTFIFYFISSSHGPKNDNLPDVLYAQADRSYKTVQPR
jgi:hypothetical protein